MARRTRSVLLGLAVEEAIRVRHCGHNRTHAIPAGERCLTVTAAAGSKKSYCRACGHRMLEAAQATVNRTVQLLPTD